MAGEYPSIPQVPVYDKDAVKPFVATEEQIDRAVHSFFMLEGAAERALDDPIIASSQLAKNALLEALEKIRMAKFIVARDNNL